MQCIFHSGITRCQKFDPLMDLTIGFELLKLPTMNESGDSVKQRRLGYWGNWTCVDRTRMSLHAPVLSQTCWTMINVYKQSSSLLFCSVWGHNFANSSTNLQKITTMPNIIWWKIFIASSVALAALELHARYVLIWYLFNQGASKYPDTFCHKLTSMNGKFNGSCCYASGVTYHTHYIIRLNGQRTDVRTILVYWTSFWPLSGIFIHKPVLVWI
jgi:hypothetical protein